MQHLHIPLPCVALACMIGLVAECCVWSRERPTSLFEFQHVAGGVAVVSIVWCLYIKDHAATKTAYWCAYHGRKGDTTV